MGWRMVVEGEGGGGGRPGLGILAINGVPGLSVQEGGAWCWDPISSRTRSKSNDVE